MLYNAIATLVLKSF